MSQTRLIVAEDEALIRQDLCETLIELGYLIAGEARTGDDAIRLTRALHPDLVVMDIKLPGMNGLDAAAMIWHERLAPIMIVTGYVGDELVAKAKSAGVAGYLVKPYRRDTLGPAIELACSCFAMHQERETRLGDVKHTLATQKLVERAKGQLMSTHQLSARQASERMEHLAEQTQQSLHDVAEAILLAGQLSRGRT